MTTVTQPLSQLLNNQGSSSSSSAAAATGSSSSTASTVANAQQSLNGNEQTFLKLLTTQLQNQDPLSPLDTNQFTQQLVSMTGVQQQIVSNQLLQQLVNGQSAMGSSVNLIGKSVTANTSSATLQNGQASWGYALSAPASAVQEQVINSTGQVVWQQNAGAQAAGPQSLTWNGKDQYGNQLSNGGTYTLQVNATDSGGNAVASSVYQSGTAGAVVQSNGQTDIMVNGVPVPVSSITAVGAGP